VDWQLTLIIILGALVVLMSIGLPVAFCFLAINVVGAFLFWKGELGLEQLVSNLITSVASFTMMPILLFVLMGEVMFISGVGPMMLDTLDKWLGRLPGRLSLLAVAAGTLFGALTGASMASVAMLGSNLMPEMEKRGYKKPMTMGPILGSGGLAILIPPSSIAVLVGAIGEISIGRILLAIILPGLVLAGIFSIYIILRCTFNPSLAPSYQVDPTPLSVKLIATVKYVLPIGIILFLVVGIIFVGLATPEEAAASGTLGSFLLAAAYRRLTWEVLKKTFHNTLKISVMILMIICGAAVFSQIMSFSGASRGLTELAISLPLSPIMIIITMQLVGLFLGCFISVIAIMMICLPIFMPIITAFNFDPVWFAVLFVINMEVAQITPPYGMSLFVMKGIAPDGTTTQDIWRASVPFILLDIVLMVLIMIFPDIALWLPNMKLKP